MQIQVLTTYRGRLTGEQPIYKGEYDAADERLFGLARYLVDNGHARVLAETPVADPVSIDTADEPTEAQEQALADGSEAFEEIPNTRAVRRKGK